MKNSSVGRWETRDADCEERFTGLTWQPAWLRLFVGSRSQFDARMPWCLSEPLFYNLVTLSVLERADVVTPSAVTDPSRKRPVHEIGSMLSAEVAAAR